MYDDILYDILAEYRKIIVDKASETRLNELYDTLSCVPNISPSFVDKLRKGYRTYIPHKSELISLHGQLATSWANDISAALYEDTLSIDDAFANLLSGTRWMQDRFVEVYDATDAFINAHKRLNHLSVQMKVESHLDSCGLLRCQVHTTAIGKNPVPVAVKKEVVQDTKEQKKVAVVEPETK